MNSRRENTDVVHYSTQCCIAGGGPAGMMLGFLLAREGIDVMVLEKWPDFFRDFRGDTVHPSTMEVLHELGLLEEFLKQPHQKTSLMEVVVNGHIVPVVDFSHLSVHAPYIAFMPQWDFLNFIRTQASKYPNFHLCMETEAVDIVQKDGVVTGVQAVSKEKNIEIQASLVVGTDGRHSTIREKSGLQKITTGTPIDVLWFSLPKQQYDTGISLGYFQAGHILVALNRGTYWQCGYIIPKGSFEHLKAEGIDSFQDALLQFFPRAESSVRAIENWKDIKLLSVTVDYMPRWYREGLICIGDAAHAMSPIGGVGINFAVQDAVASARILASELLQGNVSVATLQRIQKRRSFPARSTQKIQVLLQNKLIQTVLTTKKIKKVPLPLRLFATFPYLRRIPAFFVGIGIRPEHISKKIDSNPPS